MARGRATAAPFPAALERPHAPSGRNRIARNASVVGSGCAEPLADEHPMRIFDGADRKLIVAAILLAWLVAYKLLGLL